MIGNKFSARSPAIEISRVAKVAGPVVIGLACLSSTGCAPQVTNSGTVGQPRATAIEKLQALGATLDV